MADRVIRMRLIGLVWQAPALAPIAPDRKFKKRIYLQNLGPAAKPLPGLHERRV